MVDPLSYLSFQPVLHDWCNKGLCYPVCGMVHINSSMDSPNDPSHVPAPYTLVDNRFTDTTKHLLFYITKIVLQLEKKIWLTGYFH